MIGSEKELLARYSVGRNVLRQALSILEMRGIGKVRRGPAGGLLVSEGDWQGLVTFLANYLRWIGTNADDVARTQRLIAETDRRASASLVGGRLPWTALGPYSLVMETLAACRNDAEIKLPFATTGAHLNRLAARVVAQLAREITHERCVEGAYLGSIQQLSDRYGLDRRTLAQAIRLIADFDVLDIQRGRNGGLFLRTPRSEAIVRLVHGPLLALRLPLDETHAVVWMLNCIHARAAAERGIVTPEIRSSLENLQRTHGRTGSLLLDSPAAGYRRRGMSSSLASVLTLLFCLHHTRRRPRSPSTDRLPHAGAGQSRHGRSRRGDRRGRPGCGGGRTGPVSSPDR